MTSPSDAQALGERYHAQFRKALVDSNSYYDGTIETMHKALDAIVYHAKMLEMLYDSVNEVIEEDWFPTEDQKEIAASRDTAHKLTWEYCSGGRKVFSDATDLFDLLAPTPLE